MSFSRNIFDEESYKQIINQSVGPGLYSYNVPKHSCDPCYPSAPTVRMQKQGVSHLKGVPLVDVDSELSGITRKLSRNINDSYMPSCPDNVCNSGEVCGQGVIGNCGIHTDEQLQHWKECFTPAEDTRLSNPSCNLRSTGWNRWEHLICGNPQDRVEIPFNWNISNRILSKDNHRPCIPNPIDPTPALPMGGEMPCEQTSRTCAVATQPASVHWQNETNIKQS
jgi:hypothetical protein